MAATTPLPHVNLIAAIAAKEQSCLKKSYAVGDCDFVAAFDEDGAIAVLANTNGDEPINYADWDVELVDDEQLDKPWCDEDDRTKIVGTLREWLAAATEPTWFAGTE